MRRYRDGAKKNHLHRVDIRDEFCHCNARCVSGSLSVSTRVYLTFLYSFFLKIYICMYV